MKKNLKTIGALFLAASIGFTSCSKDDNASTTLQVKMTDAPGAFTKVNVDIREVLIKYTDDTTSADGWVKLQTNAGIYDLLTLQNNVDTLIGSITIPQQTVKQIRLVLGTNNSVETIGQVFPLTIPSGSESGLKIKLNKTLNSSLETVVIDFDANASIKLEIDGTYKLRPVITVR
ncbi:MAG: DUF4382 domain-containing protein [Ferruginibacter sp.]